MLGVLLHKSSLRDTHTLSICFPKTDVQKSLQRYFTMLKLLVGSIFGNGGGGGRVNPAASEVMSKMSEEQAPSRSETIT